jgi:hypothetical protein
MGGVEATAGDVSCPGLGCASGVAVRDCAKLGIASRMLGQPQSTSPLETWIFFEISISSGVG